MLAVWVWNDMFLIWGHRSLGLDIVGLVGWWVCGGGGGGGGVD